MTAPVEQVGFGEDARGVGAEAPCTPRDATMAAPVTTPHKPEQLRTTPNSPEQALTYK